MRVLLSLLLIHVALSASGFTKINLVSGTVSDLNNEIAIPSRTVEEVADGIIVTYKFYEVQVAEDNLFPGSSQLTIPGFSVITQSGKPAVSEHIDVFAAPAGSNPQVTLLTACYHDFNYTLAPARFPLSENDTVAHTAMNVTPITPYKGYYPEKACIQLASGDYRGQPMARVKVCPIQYDFEGKSIRAYSEISYKIVFSNRKGPSDIYYEPNSLLNPNCEKAPSSGARTLEANSIAANAGYLIITVPEMEYPLMPFVKWKKQMGYNVVTKTKSDWTPDEVKSTVRDLFAHDKSLMYLLIVGDHSKVPGESKEYVNDSGSGYTYITDFHYGCLGDSTDFIPDLFRGRIPVRNANDLETVVDKILWYEQYPLTDPYFYANATHFAYFEDEEPYHKKKPGDKIPDGIEDGRFVKTSEEIRDYIMGHQDLDVERLYNAQIINYPGPRQWNPQYTNGDTIPAELMIENRFNWTSNQNSLVSSFNDGRLYMLYRGHGFPGGWFLGHQQSETTKPFDKSQINKLANHEMMPLVFSITCETGKHTEDDCFARSMLVKKNGGTMGLFAQTETGYFGYNDKLVSLMFNAIWPKPGFEPEKIPIRNYLDNPYVMQSVPIYSLGGIVDFAINGFDADEESNRNTDLYTKRITHCFGDPSMQFITKTPTIFEGAVIERGENNIRTLLNENAYISFYDPTIDKSFLYYGSEATYRFTNSNVGKYVSVAVHKHNRLPIIDPGVEYSGTISATSSSQILGWRDMKSGSRVEIDYIINPSDKGKNISILIVDMATGAFISQQQIDTSITNQKQTIGMYTNSGVMTASLMVDGYPVSNVKMYISK